MASKGDVIYRQAAMDAFEMFGEYESNRTNKDWVRLIKVVLSDLPSAQPKRKTGKWVKISGFVTPGGDPVWQCSECGKGRHVYGIEHGTYGADVAEHQWRSCPNCDALMVEV